MDNMGPYSVTDIKLREYEWVAPVETVQVLHACKQDDWMADIWRYVGFMLDARGEKMRGKK